MRATHLLIVAVVALLTAAWALHARAHCDTLQGPVVTAARAALSKSDVKLVLPWVRERDEPEIKRVFEQTLAVRRLSPQARELADRFFFETLVRLHRAGEGAPYAGLSDDAPEPVIVDVDAALARGNAQELEEHLIAALRRELAVRFATATLAKKDANASVERGRAYVEQYVRLTHWAEGVHGAIEGRAHEEHDTLEGGHPDEP